jgi:DNA processing protein
MEPAAEDWLRQPRHHRLDLQDERYPALLRDIPDPPDTLWVAGDPAPLGLPQLAIVGSRNATPDGVDTARRFAAFLAARGFCITSGLAEGIDTAAHLGALDAGGITIAVCGTGLDRVYPAGNAALADRIQEAGGALVSEYPPGTPVHKGNFPKRNRIISGLSLGTLVVEANVRSGALITARLAGEQGREVYAIPGSIHNPLSRGCHRLIREGAKLVETGQDILEELGGLLAALGLHLTAPAAGRPGTNAEPAAAAVMDAQYARLLEQMGHGPVDMDTLVSRCGLTAGELSSMLLILEMQGLVRSLAGGRYQRVYTAG